MGRYSFTIGCPKCGGSTKKNGHRYGRQRYRCLNCRHAFFRRRFRLSVAFRDFKAFRQYAVKTVDQETLFVRLKFSRQTLSARFNLFLLLPPSPALVNTVAPPACCSTTLWVYGYDGKWLGRNPILLIHRDVINGETLWWSVAFSENMAAEGKQLALMMWRLAFSRIKTKRQLLTLWAYWKRAFF